MTSFDGDADEAHTSSSEAVVAVSVQVCLPDTLEPWKDVPPRPARGAGCVVGYRLILTTAHNISFAREIYIERRDERVRARPLRVCHDCDLALLVVQEASFVDEIAPILLGSMPRVGDSLTTYSRDANSSDSDAAMIEAFHVVKHVEGDELAKMRSLGVDLERDSGKTHHEIAIPSLFLIDRSGIVRWAHSDPDFKVRPSVAQMLAAIDQKLAGSGGSP